jgi:proline racemase
MSADQTYTFSCLDGHTCGNPVRLVSGGGPLLQGASMSERRQDFLSRFDWVRKALMFEPRGHDVMSGSILYPPTRADCDIGILFIETSGCLPMCGHGTIGTVTGWRASWRWMRRRAGWWPNTSAMVVSSIACASTTSPPISRPKAF